MALVDAYLQVNGYFTVVEYPVIGASDLGGYQEITDLDLLAFRFASAGRLVPRDSDSRQRRSLLRPDPALGVNEGSTDMLVVEVKQGRAALNPPARTRDVLQAALVRFGCCERGDVAKVASAIQRKGRAQTHTGHLVRSLVFGARVRPVRGADRVISLAHVTEYLFAHLERHWDVYHATQLRHPALGVLMTIEKARRAEGSVG